MLNKAKQRVIKQSLGHAEISAEEKFAMDAAEYLINKSIWRSQRKMAENMNEISVNHY